MSTKQQVPLDIWSHGHDLFRVTSILLIYEVIILFHTRLKYESQCGKVGEELDNNFQIYLRVSVKSY